MSNDCVRLLAGALLVVCCRDSHGAELGLRFGGGTVLSGVGTQKGRALISLALEGAMSLRGKHGLVYEARYREFRSEPYDATKLGGEIRPETSVDIRRNPLTSFGVGVGYGYEWRPTFRWVCGVSLDRTVSTQEVSGQLKTNAGIEGLNHTPSKSSLRPGVFAGFQWRMTEAAHVSVQVGSMSFAQVEYVPRRYQGTREAQVVDQAQSKLLLDVGVGFRF